MSDVKEPGKFSTDTYDSRLIRLKQFTLRFKLVLGGTAGLLFFVGTDLINDWEKFILVIWVLLNLFFGYFALLAFEDAQLDIEYKLLRNEGKGSEQADGSRWPAKDERRYRYIALCLPVLAILLLGCILYNFVFADKPSAENSDRIFKMYTTSAVSFSIGPFVEGFDTLYADSMARELAELESGMATPPRKYTQIDIYGGVDKRPLKGLSKKIFGDNITLGQARAEWVKGQITHFNCIGKSCRFFTGVSGARKYSAQNYSADDFAVSRYVIINCQYQDSVLTSY